ncbi:hypothetical protein CROQUDRAFT_95925 [Cronartium quercuum f. sp. fusiforme G11]|uniref:Uncharacterized protein n=1 Tax=Cronartium quercuum f. sp. fusiforme G11 TaxID=708437 RepID=A0A9P6NHN3_9BASI|nr:hypothetical protein CROQUDRAFT_95925 [Cronartium quercuum f. sp. fusiforme G11]
MLSNKVFSVGVVLLLACYVNVGFVIVSPSEEDMLIYSPKLMAKDDGLNLAELSRFYIEHRESSLEKRDEGNTNGDQHFIFPGDSVTRNSADTTKQRAKSSGACIRVGQTLWGLLSGPTLMVLLA